jgi:hypothetical protein
MSRKLSYVSAIDFALSVLSQIDAAQVAIPAEGEDDTPISVGDVVEKMTALREAQMKRSTSKKAEGESKTHKANVELAEKVYTAMVAGEVYDNKGIKALVPELVDATPQKLAPIMACLKGRVVATKVKGRVSYTLAQPEAAE